MAFPMVFTIFPGQLPSLFESNLGGVNSLNGLYTYPAPPLINRSNINYGMSLPQFSSAYQTTIGQPVNFLSVAGYNTALVIQKTLATANSLNQLSLRHAVSKFSGKLRTLDGTFQINSEGAQVGETLPVGRFSVNSSGQLQVNLVTPLQ